MDGCVRVWNLKEVGGTGAVAGLEREIGGGKGDEPRSLSPTFSLFLSLIRINCSNPPPSRTCQKKKKNSPIQKHHILSHPTSFSILPSSHQKNNKTNRPTHQH